MLAKQRSPPKKSHLQRNVLPDILSLIIIIYYARVEILWLWSEARKPCNSPSQTKTIQREAVQDSSEQPHQGFLSVVAI